MIEELELLDSLIEHFSKGNCGIGPDGFEKNNTCAKGTGGINSQADARKYVKQMQKSAQKPTQQALVTKKEPKEHSPKKEPSPKKVEPSSIPNNNSINENSVEQKKQQIINRYTEMAKAAGISVIQNGSSRIHDSSSSNGAIAMYFKYGNEIAINEKNPFFLDPKGTMKELHSSGWLSSDSEDHVIRHEIGHSLHYKNVGMDRYREIERNSIDPYVLERIKNEVSEYATKNNLEVAAEMYAGLKAGKTYSKLLMNYYEFIGGPPYNESNNIENHSYELLDFLIEYFDHSSENCGIGPKGFERGNECAKGGKGIQSQADARKAVKAAQKTLKSPGIESTDVPKSNPSKTAPSLPGQSDSAAGGTKQSGRSIKDLKSSETIKTHEDSIMKGNIPTKQELPSDRAAKALAAHKPVTNDMKAIAKEREQDIAKGLGGNWLSDHEPVDVVLDLGKSIVGIEVKTVFENTRGSLTIDPAANFNKVNWTKANKGARIDIVVYDDKNKVMYYKRGVGSFSIDAMHKITGGMDELKKLVAMKETDKKFPANASYQTSTVYHTAVSDPEAYKTLQERALKSFLDKEIRRARSKENAGKLKAAQAEVLKAGK